MPLSNEESVALLQNARMLTREILGAGVDDELQGEVDPDANGYERLRIYLEALRRRMIAQTRQPGQLAIERLNEYVRSDEGHIESIVLVFTPEETEQFGMAEFPLSTGSGDIEDVSELEELLQLLQHERGNGV